MSGEDAPDPSFVRDVREGLSSTPKFLKSKYFYDAKGDRLFQRIMGLEEYYPSRAENAILRDQGREILEQLLPENGQPLRIVEFGAGDASKTRHLLSSIPEAEMGRVRYMPNDISANVLEGVQEKFKEEFPELDVEPLPGDHASLLAEWEPDGQGIQAFLFLGGNIGNYSDEEEVKLLQRFASGMKAGDRLLAGFDMKKDPHRILRAYNDREGVTRDFNLNLLERMNRELGADFDLAAFLHHPLYDPVLGEARSYLVSTRDQDVHIGALAENFHFDAWESVFMERSRKFTSEGIEGLAERTGFRIQKGFSDPQGDFVDSLWVKA